LEDEIGECQAGFEEGLIGYSEIKDTLKHDITGIPVLLALVVIITSK
jgi:hypothetical protein